MRGFWPREHGAYGQLGAPLLAALVARTPTAAAGLLAAAAILAFVAHEPLLVLRGHRGKRQREAGAGAARWWLAVTAAAALATGTAGLALAPGAAAALAGVVAVPAVVGLVLAWRRAEHNVAGEVIAATALAGAAAPVMVATGASWPHATLVWAGWSVGFAASVIAVHRVIARNRRAAMTADRVVAAGLALVTLAGGAAVAVVPALAAATPLAAISAVLVAWPPRATRLRAVGVALLVAALAGAGLVVALTPT